MVIFRFQAFKHHHLLYFCALSLKHPQLGYGLI
jgi:hypothetical protein